MHSVPPPSRDVTAEATRPTTLGAAALPTSRTAKPPSPTTYANLPDSMMCAPPCREPTPVSHCLHLTTGADGSVTSKM
eukprot:2582325-Prymnesium_polylepis.1